ncbi:YkgJ family cysteine cluster protein [Deferribacterales bacterium Es71-Z0220]|uniref:YkgJ family cysteine cluster protein n=1 Tax=Deferrivibrio essentukiensis TaxID=2880922 RepID=UPI001F606F87|nr:YkgJ family cysteine cluster protein [Deferrivibrio essentukiensis]MCB4205345.1 YkgJ family cysteine cluster protein [Deferrivibrio essentukiensis]
MTVRIMYTFNMGGFDLKVLENKFDEVLNYNIPLEEKLNKLLSICDNIIRENHNEFNLKEIDCKAGCGHCCILNIATLEPEIKNIIDYVNKHFDKNKRVELKAKIQENYIMVVGLDDDERISIRRKCVFLDENASCSIYPVRPILCRSVTSISAESCKEVIAAASFGENVPIISNLYVKDIYITLFNAIYEFLGENDVEVKSKKLTVWLKKYIDNIED